MTKEEYANHLLNDKWKKKRIKILKRDGFCCRGCGSEIFLHVHHKYYEQGKLPWEYPNSALITLCEYCHTLEHKGKTVSDFIRKKKNKKPKKKQKKSNKLSKRDSLLQEKYNKLRKEGKLPK